MFMDCYVNGIANNCEMSTKNFVVGTLTYCNNYWNTFNIIILPSVHIILIDLTYNYLAYSWVNQFSLHRIKL